MKLVDDDARWEVCEEKVRALDANDYDENLLEVDLEKLHAFVDEAFEGVGREGWDYTLYEWDADGFFVIVISNYRLFSRELLFSLSSLVKILASVWLVKIEVMDSIKDGIMYGGEDMGLFLIEEDEITAWLSPQMKEDYFE